MKRAFVFLLGLMPVVIFGQEDEALPPPPVISHSVIVENVITTRTIFTPERLPVFPGGESALQDFAKEQWKAQKQNQRLISGYTLSVSFTIDSTGKVMNVKVLSNKADAKINAVAMTFISSMPKWIPGGTGEYGKAGSSNTAVIMIADVFLGYEGVPARITILPRPSLPQSAEFVYLAPDLKEKYKVYGNVPDSIFADSIPELAKGGIQRFLLNNIKYPIIEKENNKQGTVYLNFIVEKDGTVSIVNVIQGVEGAPGLTKETFRVINLLPKMSPGTVKGKPVRVRMTIPVKYVLM